MSKIFYFSLPTITCSSCVSSIEGILEENRSTLKIKSYVVNLTEKKLSLEFDSDDPTELISLQQQLIHLLDDEGGFPCSLVLKPNPEYFRWVYAAIGILTGLGLLILSMTGLALPVYVMAIIGVISTGLTLFLGKNSFLHAITQWKKTRSLNMDTLFTISSLSLIVVSIVAFFIPWLPMMFETGLLIFGFRHLGIAIRNLMTNKMMAQQKFQARAPRMVRVVLSDGTFEDKSLSMVIPGETIFIDASKADTVIPLDGECLTANATVTELLVTGQTSLRNTKNNEILLAGMVIPRGYPAITLKVVCGQQDSFLARLDANIDAAISKKAPIQAYADKILQYFIPFVFGLSILSGIVIGIFFSPMLAIQCAASVLVSACPCTLGFVVPLAISIGIHKMQANGILRFNDSSMIEAADSIDAVVFDLNGTLTEGRPEVVRGEVFDDAQMGFDDILNIAANLEINLSHSFAKAIWDHATQRLGAVRLLDMTVETNQKTASGVIGSLGEDEWALGNMHLMQEQLIDILPLESSVMTNPTETVLYIAKNKKVVGYFVVNDPLRVEARETLASLRRLGKSVYICTGADQGTALRYANELDIPTEHVFADRTPLTQTKTDFIRDLQAQHLKVAMIGEAGNDASPIALSDLGIAIQSKSSDVVTQDAAGIVIENGSLQPVLNTFVIARQTMRQIKQNLWFSLAYNMVSLLLAGGLLVGLGFVLNPGIGVAIMILQTCLILANAYRFNKQKVPSIVTSPAEQNTAVDVLTDETEHSNLSELRPVSSLAAEPPEEMNNYAALFRPTGSTTRRLNVSQPPILTVHSSLPGACGP